MRVKMILTIAFAAVGAYFLFFNEKYRVYKRYKSPDKKYELIVYVSKSTGFDASSHSEADYKKAYVELIDRRGKRIVTKGDCYFTIGDLYVEWKMEEQVVYYNKFDYIDLKSGKNICK